MNSIKTEYRTFRLAVVLTILVFVIAYALFVLSALTILLAQLMQLTGVLILGSFFSIPLIWILSDLNSKLNRIKIIDENLYINHFFGWKKLSINLSELEGFKICFSTSQIDKGEVIYAYHKGKRIFKISEFYTYNYEAFRQRLRKSAPFWGYEEYNFINDYIDQYKKEQKKINASKNTE